MDNLLTMSQAARYLGCSVSSIRNYTKHKSNYNLPCVRTVGQHRKIRQSDLDAFISKHLRLPIEPNTGNTDEQGFGEEPEQTLTCKNVNFDPTNTPSDKLFRQRNEKAKTVKTTNSDHVAKPTTEEILKKLKGCFDAPVKDTNVTEDGTPIEAEGE